MHTISSYHGNRPTNTYTNTRRPPARHKQDRQQYTAPLSLTRSVTTAEGHSMEIIPTDPPRGNNSQVHISDRDQSVYRIGIMIQSIPFNFNFTTIVPKSRPPGKVNQLRPLFELVCLQTDSLT